MSRRVLVVPKWYPWPDRPIFGLFCREHARALSRHHDVVVLASLVAHRPDFAVYRLTDEVEDGIRTLRLRYRRPWFRPAAMACQLIGMLAALRRLRREGWRPDVVHAHVYSAALPALLLARLSGALAVVTEHYTGFQRGLVTGYDRLTARAAFRGADLVAPVSEDLAGHLRELSPRARIRVLPNVVDTDVFTPAPHDRHEGPRRLLAVGALAKKKGHRHLLEALVELENVVLAVVGDGELRASLAALARDLGLADRVRFHGELAKEEVARMMREADLLVLPSLHETFGCVLIEAAASGLPAVASQVGGVPEVLDPEGGELVPAGDPKALAAAIEHMLGRELDRPALAERTASRYGYEAFAAMWTSVYDELRPSRAGSTDSATVRLSDSSR